MMKVQNNMQAQATHDGMIEARRCRECGNKSWYNYPEKIQCVRCGDVKEKTPDIRKLVKERRKEK